MNWFKIAQKYPPIAITSYDKDLNLGITFNGGKKYIYKDINPDNYNYLRTLLSHKNYRAAQALLSGWSEVDKERKREKQEALKKEEDEQGMLNELYDRGYLK